MRINANSTRNWFDQDGRAYAKYRPEYPAQLASYLASVTVDKKLAIDVGCGNGQLTQLLAPYFSKVVGFDPSTEQLANINASEHITYRCASAEQLPLADNTASLVTAAQAAHWFKLPAFYREVRRISIPGGVLALISYGILELEPDINERFQKFYWDEIAPYWPPERKLVDAGYKTLTFPFEEFTAPSLNIQADWSLSSFLGYLGTWSAVRHAQEIGQEEVLSRFALEIAEA